MTETSIDIAVHLPDNPGSNLVEMAFRLIQPKNRGWVFTHFDPWLPLPPSGVGLENALNCYDAGYLEKWLEASSLPGRFRVFDPSRLFHGANDVSSVEKETARIIRELSAADLLHLVDLEDEHSWLPLGQGVLAPLLSCIRESEAPIVFEYEDLETCIESRKVLLISSRD